MSAMWKMILAAGLCPLISLGCHEQAAERTPANEQARVAGGNPMNGETSQLERNKAVVRKFLEEGMLGHMEAFDETCAPDIVNHAAAPGRPPGIPGIKEVIKFSITALQDQKWTAQMYVAEGDMVVVYGVRGGTWMAPQFRGMQTPTGKHVAVELAHMFRLENGKIKEHWAIRDDLGMMQQLGVISSSPPPAAPTAPTAAASK